MPSLSNTYPATDPSRRIPQIDLEIAAQQTGQGLFLERPIPERPVYYVAYDAGYRAAIARENPPSPTVVAQTLQTALGLQGYRPATAQTPPSLVLVYVWGAVGEGFGGFAMGAVSEEFGGLGLGFQSGPSVVYYRNVVIVSAYDYRDLLQHVKTLLWRVQLSAHQTGKMREELPALIAASAPYFGRDLKQDQLIRAPLIAPVEGESASQPSPLAIPPDIDRQVDAGVVHDLFAWERDKIFPTPLTKWPAYARFPMDRGDIQAREPRTVLIRESEGKPVGLPPALARRITAYLQEKFAVQDALAAKLKAEPPGGDSRGVIDTFTKTNADRISALIRERDAIRDELASVVAGNSPAAGDASLDAILRAFAADVRQMDGRPRSNR